MSVYDSINLEYIPINDFINNDNDNIVIIHKDQAYGINKSMITSSNEMKKCIIVNNQLLKKQTYNEKSTYFNIGFFINKKIIIDSQILNKLLKKTNILKLSDNSDSKSLYINKDFLELSTINLNKGFYTKDTPTKNNKKNLPYSDDVYFDLLISNVLKVYSGSLYFHINSVLLKPEYLNNTDLVDSYIRNLIHKYYNVRLKTNIEVRELINKEIEKIDKAFVEAAPRYEKINKNKVFYRGMKTKYINTIGNELYNIGEKTLVHNFTSITLSKAIAKRFAGANGYIYKIYLDEGLPYINMISNTLYKVEKEILLPRNIILELISKDNNEYTLIAKKYNEEQFKIKTGCISFDLYNIFSSSMKFTKEPKFVFMDFGKKLYKTNTTDIKGYIKDLENNYKLKKTTDKHFILLIGKPGAGKSYFIKNNLEKEFGISVDNFINLNPDDLRYYNKHFVKEIAGKGKIGEDYIVNGKTLQCYVNDDGNIEANIYATINTLHHIQNSMQLSILPYFFKTNKNIIYDSSCADHIYCTNLIKSALINGFKPSIICVDVPDNIAFSRAKERQKNDGRFMSDDYLNSVYSKFDIKKIESNIINSIKKENIYKIVHNNTKTIPKQDIVIPKLKRCPNGTRKNPITKECIPKKDLKNKVKLPRCPNGMRRNPKTQLCDPKD
tara:strand:- start:405 stop:2405 length:2001 start_codon:yes stop_codon:yes gene_type:complete